MVSNITFRCFESFFFFFFFFQNGILLGVVCTVMVIRSDFFLVQIKKLCVYGLTHALKQLQLRVLQCLIFFCKICKNGSLEVIVFARKDGN